ncbi:hypothetical protein FKM82_000884 [Ascaphus truei]
MTSQACPDLHYIADPLSSPGPTEHGFSTIQTKVIRVKKFSCNITPLYSTIELADEIKFTTRMSDVNKVCLTKAGGTVDVRGGLLWTKIEYRIDRMPGYGIRHGTALRDDVSRLKQLDE